MRVYLDDERNVPARSNWVLVRTAKDAIELLGTGLVTTISLDHDLGTARTGNDVLVWIERETATNNKFVPPRNIHVHSANASVKKKMLAGIESIKKLMKQRNSYAL